VLLPAAELKAAVQPWSGGKPSRLVANAVEYLLRTTWQTAASKSWVVLPEVDPDEEDLMALPTATALPQAAVNKLVSEVWLGVLKQPLSVELYKEILVHMHTEIVPLLPATSVLQLADFLTDSYNIGGIVSLLSLNALFVLISKHNLDYPSFFRKLYAVCRPFVFHAKYRARFFQLVALFLTSAYVPSTLVCAFAKRFARLALTAPPSGAIFCIAVIYNLLRRHPVCRPLINRALKDAPLPGAKAIASPAAAPSDATAEQTTVALLEGAPVKPTVGGGILSSLSSLLSARQAAVTSGALADATAAAENEGNDALLLSLPRYQAPAAEHDLSRGSDPYLFEESDPEQSRAAGSSLWEVQALTEHYSPTVANLAKVFFTTHAPKKDLEMDKYIQQSYETLFEKELTRRANQKVALQQAVKFGGLFADSSASIGLTFALPAPSIAVEEDEEDADMDDE